jgi:hypothetical protein
LAEPEVTDWVYAAAFVDGEGCISIVRSFVAARGRYYYGVHVVIANRDRSVLDWFQRIWGGWVVAVPRQGQGRSRDCWNWRCPTGGSAKPFLTGIRPWLRIKSAQCDNALAMIELLIRSRRTLGRKFMPPEWVVEQEQLYWIQRECNHRGSDAFEAKPMHSPRKIHRARYTSNLCFPKAFLSAPLSKAETGPA